jgi:hypothetical protein
VNLRPTFGGKTIRGRFQNHAHQSQFPSVLQIKVRQANEIDALVTEHVFDASPKAFLQLEWRPAGDNLSTDVRARDQLYPGNTGEPTEPDDIECLLEAIAKARGLLQNPENSIAR